MEISTPMVEEKPEVSQEGKASKKIKRRKRMPNWIIIAKQVKFVKWRSLLSQFGSGQKLG